jgi:hypothetical protein
MCSMALACDPSEVLDDAGTMGSSGGSDANTVSTSDSASAVTTDDAGVIMPSDAGGGNPGVGNPGVGNPDAGSPGGGDASSGTSGLDASLSDRDAGTGGVVVGPSMRRDGGPTRWDPDAAGPVLNAEVQAACMMLAQNVCNRVAECDVSLVGLDESRRARAFESCRNTFLVTHNCNRAVAMASGLAACSEETKTGDCLAVFTTEFGSSCVDQITFQP